MFNKIMLVLIALIGLLVLDNTIRIALEVRQANQVLYDYIKHPIDYLEEQRSRQQQLRPQENEENDNPPAKDLQRHPPQRIARNGSPPA